MAKKQLMKQAEKVIDEDREESSDKEMDLSTNGGDQTTINLCYSNMKHYVFIELHLNDDQLILNGFMNKALTRVGLKFILCTTPEEIYPITVFEFLGYLDTEKLTTQVTCIHPKTHTPYIQEVNLLDFTTAHLKLRNEGEDVMKSGNRVEIAEKNYQILSLNMAQLMKILSTHS